MRTHRARVVPARQISLAPFFARSIASFSRKRPPIFRKLLPRCFFVIVLKFTSFYRRHSSLFVFVLQTFLSAAVSFYYFSLLGPPEAANSFLQTVTPGLLFPKVKKGACHYSKRLTISQYIRSIFLLLLQDQHLISEISFESSL